MRVLVACEESQVVTIEFRKRGHEAYSCDTEPCSGGYTEWHLKQDVIPLLQEPWDMIIAFPPCTHLAVSGAAWFEEKRNDGRQRQGIDFFMEFVNCDCKKVAIENPVGIMSTEYRKPDQIIQPYYFGDSYKKTTCLWLKGLPQLVPTNMVNPGSFKEWKDKKTGKTKRQPMWYYECNMDQKNRAKLRSKTFPGIATAMASQWSKPALIQSDIF